jgi:hypothetical protein
VPGSRTRDAYKIKRIYRKLARRPCCERSRFLSAALRRECCGGKTYAHFAYALLLASIVLILIRPG